METEEAAVDIDTGRPVPMATLVDTKVFGAMATALVVAKSIPLLVNREGVRGVVCEVVRSDMCEDVRSGVCEVVTIDVCEDVRSEDVRGRVCKDVWKVGRGGGGFGCMKLLVLISVMGVTGVGEGCEAGEGGRGCECVFCGAVVEDLAPLSFC